MAANNRDTPAAFALLLAVGAAPALANSLASAGVCLALLLGFNRAGVRRLAPYLVVGFLFAILPPFCCIR